MREAIRDFSVWERGGWESPLVRGHLARQAAVRRMRRTIGMAASASTAMAAAT
jgi:hypothetical protein